MQAATLGLEICEVAVVTVDGHGCVGCGAPLATITALPSFGTVVGGRVASTRDTTWEKATGLALVGAFVGEWSA